MGAAKPRRTVSFSAAKMYDLCMLQYMYKYIYRVDPVDADPRYSIVGSAAHEAIAAWLDRGLWKKGAAAEPILVLKEIAQQAYIDHMMKVVEEKRKGLPPDGSQLTQRYAVQAIKVMHKQRWFAQNMSCESTLRVPICIQERAEPWTLVAIVDLVTPLADGVNKIVDWKSGKLENCSTMQLKLYGYAARRAGIGAECAAFVSLRDGSVVDVPISDETDREVHDWLVDTCSGISKLWEAAESTRSTEAGEYARPNGLCGYCDYRSRCPSYSAEDAPPNFIPITQNDVL